MLTCYSPKSVYKTSVFLIKLIKVKMVEGKIGLEMGYNAIISNIDQAPGIPPLSPKYRVGR